MSEIRSISEGTFVIGDTNGLTFEAGPGISVSQPSEGTVRIGNDETVLYEVTETSGVSTCTLSESPFNFQYLEIYVSDTAELAGQCNKIYILSGDIQRIHVHYNSGNNMCQFVAAKGTISSTTLTITSSIGYDAGFGSGGLLLERNLSAHLSCIRKVVGINRKENS